LETAIERDSHVLLPDGRRLAYMVYGDPSGTPVFLFHGTPGSRLAFLEDDPVATELGIRLITPDRPGYGRSDFQPGRTLLDWASDVAALADHLGIGRFAVAGASGGGPHTAACAYLLPERVTGAALISSSSPMDAPDATLGMAWGNRLGLTLSRFAPWLVRAAMVLQARSILHAPEQFLGALLEQLCESDRRVLSDPKQREMAVMHLQEAVRPGARGAAHEAVLVSRPWGFDLAEIRVPVHVWHGEADALAPISMGRHLAAAIPGSRAHFLPGVGHLVAEHEDQWRAILGALTIRAQ
jgi:pimeloyl-ACP methyl ester carboxylesterase